MDALWSAQYSWIWALGLAAALYIPMRHLIWVLAVRRAHAKGHADAADNPRLKRRCTLTAAGLAYVFSYLYTTHVFFR